MVSGIEAPSSRWNGYVEKSVAGSVHAAEMPFIDADITTGSISGSGITTTGIGAVAFRGKAKSEAETPDEARINRAEKKGRIVNVVPVAPPKFFNAGSILDRTSFILRSTVGPELKMAFVKPDIKGKEIEIAQAFYLKQDKKADPEVPAYLAALVTNEKADALATAYAPPKPDYASSSPFEALLNGEPEEGRFIPPMGKGDHAWLSNPLPASVFSTDEQTVPRQRHLFRGAWRIGTRPGRCRPGGAQSRPQPRLSQNDLRRRLPERRLEKPLPVLLRLRRRQGSHSQPLALQAGGGDRHGGHRRKDLHSGSRFLDALLRAICQPGLGADA